MSDLKSEWDFIEKYYPKYYSCDDIARSGDLCKIIDNEFEAGDCAESLLNSDYNGDVKNPQIIIDANELNLTIYGKAIMGFIKSINVEKKNAIEEILINKWTEMGIRIPDNHKAIVQYVYEYVTDNAHPTKWNDKDVNLGFGFWIESNK